MLKLKINLDENLKKTSRPISQNVYEEILEKFEKKGVLKFSNITTNPKNLLKFTDMFSKSYSNDALRRKKRLVKNRIHNVDVGFQAVKLHSETSFSPSRPEIIWFYCLKAPKTDSGKTLICDGVELWKNLSGNTKIFFLQDPICYSLKVPLIKKIKGKGKRPWFLNNPGVKSCYLNLDDGTIEFDYIKFAVQESRDHNKLCFANHLFVSLQSEPQLLARKMYNGKQIPKKIMKEINEKSKKITKKIDWKNYDLIMVDNIRFMHGREKINKKDNTRDIVIIQTSRSKFGFGHFIRSQDQ